MNISVFKVNIGKESYIWAIVSLALLTFLSYESISEGRYLSSATILLIISLIWYFSFFYPKYTVNNDELVIAALLEKRAIAIKSITKIENGNSIWTSGWSYFWYPYQKGLNIHYNKYDEIFINPEQQDEFIAKLIAINPSIEIK